MSIDTTAIRDPHSPEDETEASEPLEIQLAEIRRLLAAQAKEIIRLRIDLEAARRPWWRGGRGGR